MVPSGPTCPTTVLGSQEMRGLMLPFFERLDPDTAARDVPYGQRRWLDDRPGFEDLSQYGCRRVTFAEELAKYLTRVDVSVTCRRIRPSTIVARRKRVNCRTAG